MRVSIQFYTQFAEEFQSSESKTREQYIKKNNTPRPNQPKIFNANKKPEPTP